MDSKLRKFLERLGRDPVMPAVRAEGEALDEALSGDHPAIIVLGGNVFKLIEKIGAEERRPMVIVNVDLMGGISGDSAGIGFLSEHLEGVISTNRRVIELANNTDLITIQRLFAIDAMAMERGIKLVQRTNPRCIEILPSLAYGRMVNNYPELLDRPVLAGGFVQSGKELSSILEAGAAGVSTGYQELWKKTVDSEFGA